MKPIHCMTDIETIGCRDGAQIVQIGAVLFQPFGHVEVAGAVALDQGTISAPGHEFRSAVLVEDLTGADWSTLQWWLTKPNDAARQRVFGEGGGRPLAEVLADFNNWCGSWDGVEPTYWWSDMDFDLRILRQAYAQSAVFGSCPFGSDDGPHRGVRDYRTLRWIGKALGIEQAPRVGVEHDALDDAYHQAFYAVKVLRHLGVD